MSPTKQAVGNRGKELRHHQWQNGEEDKNLGRNQVQPGASSPLAYQ